MLMWELMRHLPKQTGFGAAAVMLPRPIFKHILPAIELSCRCRHALPVNEAGERCAAAKTYLTRVPAL